MVAVGDKIDRYVVERVLGEGGMGRVYSARDPRLGRRVALKVLLAQGASENARSEAVARMLREARAAAAFNHPNVVAIYDVGEVDGNPFIAMEEVAGSSLRAYVGDPAAINEHRFEWLVAIARGLAAAHRAGLVHRDIKPENVMVTADGVVKILDFGIARRADDAVSATAGGAHLPSLTAAGAMIGTPQYMAPEQLQAERVDGRADQFAWGVLAWELCAGVLPWGASKTGAQLVAAVLSAHVRPLSEVRPGVDARLSDVVERALAKAREQRFPTMDDLLVALEGRRARAPVPSTGDLALGDTEASVPRTPATVASPGALPPAAKESPPMTTQGAAASSRPTTGAAPMLTPDASSRRGAVVAAIVALAAAGLVLAVRSSSRRAAPPAHEAALPPAPSASAGLDARLLAKADREARDGKTEDACHDYQALAASHAPTADYLVTIHCGFYNTQGGGALATRPYFQRAWDARSALPLGQAAILDALQPMFVREPWDRKEVRDRLEAAAKAYANDPDLFGLLARSRGWFDDEKGEIEAFERSLALDPDQPEMLAVEADHLGYYGDFDRARACLSRCIRGSSSTRRCYTEQAWMDGDIGLCDKVEADARQWLASEPTSVDAEQVLANALYSQGAGLRAINTVLARKREHVDPAALAGVERADALSLAVLEGRLDEAIKLAEAQRDVVAKSDLMADHGAAARQLALLDEEAGRETQAVIVASEYLDGRDTWQPDGKFDDWSMPNEPTPTMLGIRMRANKISRDVYEREVRRAVKRWESREDPSVRSFAWIYAYAAPSETPADGAFALSTLSEYEPLPPYKPLSLADGETGRAFLLGGRVDGAIVYLEKATQNCFPLDHPLENTRAYYFLGQGREAKHDIRGACDAYRVVGDRWKAATPRSVTWDKARARMAALRCSD